jgi:hypothetical protein
MPEAAAAFARTVVAVVDPPGPARAKALLWACARLATFGIGVGLEPSPAVLLHPSVIERFVIVGTAELSGAARRTLRTNLRHVAARVGPGHPWPVALSRERAKTGYTDTEIAASGDDGIRTHDPLLAKQVLCQLSYVPGGCTKRGRKPREPPCYRRSGWSEGAVRRPAHRPEGRADALEDAPVVSHRRWAGVGQAACVRAGRPRALARAFVAMAKPSMSRAWRAWPTECARFK